MRCPACESQSFYVKSPDNKYEMYEFDFVNGEIVFRESESDPPKIDGKIEIYCNDCAWHGKLGELKA